MKTKEICYRRLLPIIIIKLFIFSNSVAQSSMARGGDYYDPQLSEPGPTPGKIICNAAVHLGNDTSLCEGQRLTLNTGIAGAHYTWQDNSSKKDYTVSRAGTYWVTVTNQNCVSSDTITVSFRSAPHITLGKDTVLCNNETLNLDAYNRGASYLWQDNSVKANYTVTEDGTYWVNVKLNGCSNTDTINVKTMACDCILNIPGAITPNGDGVNDRWIISTPYCLQEVNVCVYNRYGNLVYKKENYKDDWKGTYQSKTLPDGTYHYIVNVVKPNRHKQVLKGDLTIFQ